MGSGDRQASAKVGKGTGGRGAAALGGLHGFAEALGDRTHHRVDRLGNRRMSRDYEFLAQTTEALIYVAMIRLMVPRLAKEAT